jgi:hypothetical protein
VISGKHAKKEMVTGEKPGSSGKKNEERTPSKEAADNQKEHKGESVGSIKSHRKGDKKKKENEEGGCRRGNSPAGWRSAPALNPKMRKRLKRFACPAKRTSST